MSGLGDTLDRITTVWNDLAGRLRTIFAGENRQARTFAFAGIGIVAVALAALAFLYVGHRPSYEVLFSNLTAEDAASVTQRLKDDKVPYQLSSDGKAVYVPSSNLSDERVAIAGANVIKNGSVGYELFDRANFGMTDFQEKIDKNRAIEGELARTIEGLSPVQAARVHIATPEDTLYSSSQNPTTASVAVTTKSGMELSASQVRGITMLVSRAVEGLKPDDVTIVNQDGRVLVADNADANAPDALNMTQEQLLAKQRYENSLQSSIQSMLDQTLGPKRAVARVSTKMNFDASTTETKTYAPQGTVLSQQSERESYTGAQPNRSAIGVPGTTSNIPTYQAVQNGGTNGKYNKSKTTTNYNVSESTSKHIDAPGKVQSTSVAVLVNAGAAAPVASNANAPQTYQLTPANIAQIRNIVIAAAGLDLNSGDQVSVEAMPFNPAVTAQPTVVQPATTVLGVPVWALLAIGGVALLAGLGFLMTRLRGRRSGLGRLPEMDLPSFDSSLAEELPPFEEHPMLDGAPGIAAPIRSAADLTREQMVEYVTTVAQENPESVAKLVKLWLAE